MRYKSAQAVCPGCGAIVPGFQVPEETAEPILSPYLCDECAHPERAQAERIAREESDRQILVTAARGEILDSQGSPVPAIKVLQKGNGQYEMWRYAVNLFGELICIEHYEY